MRNFIAMMVSVCLLMTRGMAAEKDSLKEFQNQAIKPGFAKDHPLKESGESVKLRGTLVTLGDYGAEDLAYLSIPDEAPTGGVVVIHEWWGLNESVKKAADRLASDGFVVLAVDLYNGDVIEDPTRAGQRMKHLRPEGALKTIRAGVKFLKESPKFKVPKVASYGWCLGGGLSLQAAMTIETLDAAVIYYGPIELNREKVKKIKIPVCGMFALKDDWIPVSDVKQFEKTARDEKLPLEISYFDAGHAFANPSNAKYDPKASAQAYGLTLNFLRRELTKPVKKEGFFEKIF